MLIDAADGVITGKETIATGAHNCGSLPRLLAQHGVGVVLAGGMGFSPRMAFQSSGIDVVLGVAESDPEKAVLSHLSHTLSTGNNVCEHGDEPCDHSGEHHHGHGHSC
jgi:predicted Fe-Mo cluster-binding NifX family protein